MTPTGPPQDTQGPRQGARRFDQVRFAVSPAPEDSAGGFQLQVFINGHEVTGDAAGMGMDPYDVLIPANRLAALPEPHRTPIARCNCGSYGCGMTDITISRDEESVRWDWHIETPMDRSVTFVADQYDAEVARIQQDHSWETPERVAGRLILQQTDVSRLAEHDLQISWLSTEYSDPTQFCVCLDYAGSHQIFIHWPWQNRTPTALAAELVAYLATPPAEWTAAWHAINRNGVKPPIAGANWWHFPI